MGGSSSYKFHLAWMATYSRLFFLNSRKIKMSLHGLDGFIFKNSFQNLTWKIEDIV